MARAHTGHYPRAFGYAKPTHGGLQPTHRGNDSGVARTLLIVANRLPLECHEADGGTSWVRAPGGLVTALDGALSSAAAQWIGWSGRACDADSDVPELPLDMHDCRLREVPLTADEVSSHYEGFCNATLWPLYHDAVAPVVYSRDTFRTYESVNRRFCDVVARRRREEPWCGFTTTSCSCCQRCCENCGQTCTSGSSCTSPSLPRNFSDGCRGASRFSRASSVLT